MSTLPARLVSAPALDEVSFWHLLGEYVLVRRGEPPSASVAPRFHRLDPAHAVTVLERTLERHWPHVDWHLLHVLGITEPSAMTHDELHALVRRRLSGPAAPHELYLRVRR